MSEDSATARFFALMIAVWLGLAACAAGSSGEHAAADLADGTASVAATAPVESPKTVAAETVAPTTSAEAVAQPDMTAANAEAAPGPTEVPPPSEETAVPTTPPTAVPTAVPTPAPTPTIEATPAPLLVPQFIGQFDTIGGGQIDLGSLQGQDVVLWFWAPW